MNREWMRASKIVGLSVLALWVTSAYADWTQVGGNAAHNAYIPVELSHDLRLDWYQSIAGGSQSVVIAGGSLFASSANYNGDHILQSLDAATGSKKWSTSLGSDAWALGSPTYGDGKVFVQAPGSADFRGYVTTNAYNATTGALTQTSHAYGSNGLGPFISAYSGGVLYFNVGAPTGALYSTNMTTGGTTALSYFNGGADGTAPAILGDQVVDFQKDTLRVFDRSSGGMVKAISAPTLIPGSSAVSVATPVLSGQYAFAISQERLLTFDLMQGTVAWTRSGAQSNIVVDGLEAFVVLNGQLASINVKDGSINWTKSLDGQRLGMQLIVTDNTIFVEGASSNYGSLRTFVLDRQTRDQLFSVDGGRLAWSDDHLYVATDSGIAAFDAIAVPEPSMWLMMVAGAMALVAARRQLGIAR